MGLYQGCKGMAVKLWEGWAYGPVWVPELGIGEAIAIPPALPVRVPATESPARRISE